MLLSHVLGKQRIQLYTDFDTVVDQAKLDALHRLVKRAGDHEPVAYLVGKTEFYSLEIDVSPACLIPRPETELLVQHAIDFLRTHPGPCRLLDLCTGSGCIAVAIAKNVKDTHVIATDISDEALSIAAKNVTRHGLADRVELFSGDLFDPILPYLDNGGFDLIVSNPPYVSDKEYEALDKNVKDYEPERALRAGLEGLDTIRRILERIGDFLKPDSTLMMEISYNQGPAVERLVRNTGLFKNITIKKDLQDHDRVVIASR
jgi:release factor glutamine methyltransferase